MYILRLFTDLDADKPVDARLLRDGTIRIGRDPGADWVLSDPDCRISRWHCDIIGERGQLWVRPIGANGVFDDATGERLAQDEALATLPPTALRFGAYRLEIETAAQSASRSDSNADQTAIMSPPLGSSIEVPSAYSDHAEGSAPCATGGSLLEAFCEGAGLEPSALMLEDPAVIMRRAGAVYRQMVLGVGDLMAEREQMRRQYQIARTTIGGAGNNPFKWAPTQRLALDLLLAEGHGFLSGPGALLASFQDIKKHLLATFSGLHRSLRAAVDSFSPTAIEQATRGDKSLFKSGATLQWEEVQRRYLDLSSQVDGQADGPLNAVFVQAYDAKVADLESRLS